MTADEMTNLPVDDTEEMEAKQRDMDLTSLRWEIQEEWDKRDAKLTADLIMDVVAMLRVGRLTERLSKAQVHMGNSWKGQAIELTLPDGTPFLLTLTANLPSVDPREMALDAYNEGRRPVRDRKY